MAGGVWSYSSMNRLTNTCENITFPQLLLWAINMFCMEITSQPPATNEDSSFRLTVIIISG